MEDILNDIQYNCIRVIKNQEIKDITLRDYRIIFFDNISKIIKYLDKKEIKSILEPYGNLYKLLKKYKEEGHNIDYLFDENSETEFYQNLLIFYIEEKITNDKMIYLWEEMKEILNLKDNEEIGNESENESENETNEIERNISSESETE